MTFARTSRPARLTLLALLPLAAANPAWAAPVTGVTGVWGAKLSTQFSIDGFGANQARGDGNCAITLLNNINASFSCAAFNTSSGQNYSGGISALVRNKKLGWSLDTAGLNQATANMTQWLIAKNLKKGRRVAANDIGYQFQRLDYQPIRVTDNLSQPVKGTGVLKGKVTQLVNGRYIVKKFTYQIGIKFLAKAP
jgi:hypothetical protein